MLSFFVSGDYAFAQAPPVNPETENFGFDSSFQDVAVQSDRDIKSIIATIINITLGFLGIIAVIFILYAGYMWMTAGGNEDRVTKARAIIRNGVIGMIIVFSVYGIYIVVAAIFNPNIQSYTTSGF